MPPSVECNSETRVKGATINDSLDAVFEGPHDIWELVPSEGVHGELSHNHTNIWALEREADAVVLTILEAKFIAKRSKLEVAACREGGSGRNNGTSPPSLTFIPWRVLCASRIERTPCAEHPKQITHIHS